MTDAWAWQVEAAASPDMSARLLSQQHAPRGEVPPGRHPTYWSDAAERDKRRLALYQHFVRPGDLAFDIGANVGEVTGVLLGLGCRVVAVEPQPGAASYIPPAAQVVVAACGAENGTAPFYEIPANPYRSTLRRDIADLAEGDNASWAAVERTTPVVTLDSLIAKYGLPAFVKIDVEGFEAEALRGLSEPLPALSFEVHVFEPTKAQACIDLLDALGDYGYTYSPQETYAIELWPPQQLAFYGDMYATLRSTPPPAAKEPPKKPAAKKPAAKPRARRR